jgi:hypothetical protein
MQMYCTFVLFVNQYFPGLPASGTHCTNSGSLIPQMQTEWVLERYDRAVWIALI